MQVSRFCKCADSFREGGHRGGVLSVIGSIFSVGASTSGSRRPRSRVDARGLRGAARSSSEPRSIRSATGTAFALGEGFLPNLHSRRPFEFCWLSLRLGSRRPLLGGAEQARSRVVVPRNRSFPRRATVGHSRARISIVTHGFEPDLPRTHLLAADRAISAMRLRVPLQSARLGVGACQLPECMRSATEMSSGSSSQPSGRETALGEFHSVGPVDLLDRYRYGRKSGR